MGALRFFKFLLTFDTRFNVTPRDSNLTCLDDESVVRQHYCPGGGDKMRCFLTALLLPFSLLVCSIAQADLIIEVQDASIQAGGEGFVDVLITSNADVLVSGFDLSFEITPTSGNHGTLAFKGAPDTSYVNDPTYLLGNTGFLTLRPLGLSITGSDIDTANHSLLNGISRLMARLNLVHDLPPGGSAALAAGDTFTISALASTTVYDDNVSSITPLTASPGTITVGSAVPEPATWTTGLLLVLGGIWHWHNSRRRPGVA